MHEYSQADLARLFRLSAADLDALARADFITRSAIESKTSYSFQDLLIFRTASALKAAQIPTPKMVTAIGNIRAALSPGSVLASMALSALENELAGETQVWDAHPLKHAIPAMESSQAATPLVPTPLRTPAHLAAQQHYVRGHALEDSDVAAARAAYLDALNAHSEHLDARINLGRLLHLDGELKEAEKVYRAAKSSSALLSFNLAILLEDLNREEEAISAYREALAQDPLLHDAHFNLSRLHERAQQPREALRHLLAYRRHIARHGEG
jgi:tetratricopeptide (TPR) repeat protein